MLPANVEIWLWATRRCSRRTRASSSSGIVRSLLVQSGEENSGERNTQGSRQGCPPAALEDSPRLQPALLGVLEHAAARSHDFT